MFGSSWPTPVVCRWADFIFMAYVHSGVQHVLNWWVTWRVSWKRQELLILRALRLLIFLGFCVVFFVWCVFVQYLVYPMLPVSLDCPFFIAPSVFFNFYLAEKTQLSQRFYGYLSLVWKLVMFLYTCKRNCSSYQLIVSCLLQDQWIQHLLHRIK